MVCLWHRIISPRSTQKAMPLPHSLRCRGSLDGLLTCSSPSQDLPGTSLDSEEHPILECKEKNHGKARHQHPHTSTLKRIRRSLNFHTKGAISFFSGAGSLPGSQEMMPLYPGGKGRFFIRSLSTVDTPDPFCSQALVQQEMLECWPLGRGGMVGPPASGTTSSTF